MSSVLTLESRAADPARDPSPPSERNRNLVAPASSDSIADDAAQAVVMSPELALVDPALAEWARARLPDRFGILRQPDLTPVSAHAVWSRQLATIPARPARARASSNGRWSGAPAHRHPLPKARAEAEPRPVVSAPVADDRRESPRRVGRVIRRAALFLIAVVVVGGVILAFPRSHVTRERAQSHAAPKQAEARVPPSAGAHQAAATPGRKASRVSGSKHPGATQARRKAAPASARPRATRARRTGAPTSAAAATPPTFAWAPQRGAIGYEVQFFRGHTRILVRRTVAPRLSLPRRWVYEGRRIRLTPGQYRWYVWPLRRSPRPGHLPVKQHKAAYASLWTWR